MDQYKNTGEIRSPKKGEYFLSDGKVLQAFADFTEKKLPIVLPSESKGY